MTDNRARMANVLSIAQNTERKQKRRVRKKRVADNGQSTAASAVGEPKALQTSVEVQSQAIGERLPEAEVGLMQEPRLFSDKQLEQIGVVHPRSENETLIDSLRQVRTKLFQLKPEGNFTVLVTSIVPQGGASFLALNLASTIAFDKSKTSLLIDCNIQHPSQDKLLRLLKMQPQYGLLDYLADPELGVDKIVSPSGISRMRIVPTGQRQDGDSEYLTSAKMRRFLSEIKQRYDNRYLIVDAPCISTSADARVLADLCDYIVLVAPYGGVTASQIDAVVDEIDTSKLAGIVLNNELNGG